MIRSNPTYSALVVAVFAACGGPPPSPPVDAGAPRTTCPEGSSCDDRNPCTEGDVCRDDRCVGTARQCEAPDGCTLAAACDPATGECRSLTLADGTACNDDDACTTGDSCNAGRCAGEAVVCDGPTTCNTEGMCDPLTGQCTGQVPVQDGVSCDDQITCTVMDVCQGGACSGVADPVGAPCDDG